MDKAPPMLRCTFCDHDNPPGAQRCAHCDAELSQPSDTEQQVVDDDLMSLIARGEKISAIKLFRERTGSDLKQAKDAVEALERGESIEVPGELDNDFEQELLTRL